MEEKARQQFLKKLSLQGFAIQDFGTRLELSPRGVSEAANLIIVESEEGLWQVMGATGLLGAFGRGKKRTWFEGALNSMAAQASAELGATAGSPP